MQNSNKKDLIKDIIKFLTKLRLFSIRKYLKDDLKDACQSNLSYEKFFTYF